MPFSDPPTPVRAMPLWRSHGLAALSGLLFLAAFPHLDLGWVIWFALVPFFATFPHRSLRSAIAHGLTFGLVAYGGLLYWVGVFAANIIGTPLAVVGWLIASLAQVSVILLFAAGAQWMSLRVTPTLRLWGIPALWAVLEWVRQLGELGTGWGDLAYTQHSTLAILQGTRLTGVWGLSFLIVLVNAALAGVWQKTASRRDLWGVTALVLGALIYGVFVLKTERLQPQFVAAALQVNIDQNHIVWDQGRPADPHYVRRVMDTITSQADAAARRGAVLCVTSETIFPGYLTLDTDLQQELARHAIQNHQFLLIGGNDFDPQQNRDANAIYLMDRQGRVRGDYQKRQLAPFGEFVPGRELFPFLAALHVDIYDRKVGADRQKLLDAGPTVGKIGAAICYESSYPRYTCEQVRRGAGLLVIATDDTWFGRTPAARQHTAISAVRAAESDRYVVRSASTGISTIIDPTGHVLTEAGLFQSAVLTAPVESRTTLTPYVRYGDWFIWVCLAGLAVLTVLSVRAAGTARSSDH